MSGYIASTGPRLPVSIVVSMAGKDFQATFDAHIDSKEDYTVDTPTYPIERDFDTSISTLNRQVQLTMNLFLTPYPVTWSHFFGRSIEMVKETLIRMYWVHYPVKVVTQDETYENMAIKSITFRRGTETGDAYDVNAVFVHVDDTSVYTTYVGEETTVNENGFSHYSGKIPERGGTTINENGFSHYSGKLNTGIVNNNQQVVEIVTGIGVESAGGGFGGGLNKNREW